MSAVDVQPAASEARLGGQLLDDDSESDASDTSDSPDFAAEVLHEATIAALIESNAPDAVHPFTRTTLEFRSPVMDGPPITIKQRFLVIQETGGAVYDSARVLCDFLVSPVGRELLDDRTVCVELGSGTGFVSIFAGAMGAQRVIATDGDEGTVELTAANVSANASYTQAVSVQQLRWGLNEDIRNVATDAARDVPEGSKLLVICSDLLYPGSDFGLLAATVLALLDSWSAGSAAVVFACRQRQRRNELQFFSAFEADQSLEVCRRLKLTGIGLPFYLTSIQKKV